MRYAGEWKLAGGTVDAGETIAQASARELQEEFLEPPGFKLPKTAVLRPFTVKQTRAVRSRSNLMHCFIGLDKFHSAVPESTLCIPKLSLALEDENPWLRDLNVERMNSSLELRRENFQQLVGTIERPRLVLHFCTKTSVGILFDLVQYPFRLRMHTHAHTHTQIHTRIHMH